MSQKICHNGTPFDKLKAIGFSNYFFPLGDAKHFSSDNKGKSLSKEFKNILIQHHVQH